MASYLVHYTYIGSGVMKVNARNKNAAQDIVDTKSQDELLQYCNFDDGVRRQLPCPVGDNYLDRLTDM